MAMRYLAVQLRQAAGGPVDPLPPGLGHGQQWRRPGKRRLLRAGPRESYQLGMKFTPDTAARGQAAR
jgi:hypothetical protein